MKKAQRKKQPAAAAGELARVQARTEELKQELVAAQQALGKVEDERRQLLTAALADENPEAKIKLASMNGSAYEAQQRVDDLTTVLGQLGVKTKELQAARRAEERVECLDKFDALTVERIATVEELVGAVDVFCALLERHQKIRREQASLLQRAKAPGTTPILRTALLEAHVGEKMAPLHFMPHKLPPGARDWLAVGLVEAEKKLCTTIGQKAREVGKEEVRP